jgi:DNA processing protein
VDDRGAVDFFEKQVCYSVSGGARGIDQKAHSLSLLAETPTVAFLPSGMNALYPRQFSDWIKPIVQQGGAVISEYEDEQEMQKHHFLQRNRLISALAEATLIIEAGLKSGTLLTAKQSVEQSRPVWVLPGHPLDSGFKGSVNLICEGATPVRDAQDLSVLFDSEIHGFSLRQERFSTSSHARPKTD